MASASERRRFGAEAIFDSASVSRDAWRMPPLERPARAKLSLAAKAWMGVLRLYLVVAVRWRCSGSSCWPSARIERGWQLNRRREHSRLRRLLARGRLAVRDTGSGRRQLSGSPPWPVSRGEVLTAVGAGTPQIYLPSPQTNAPNREPAPAVTPHASAPQNVTRKAPSAIGAPPAHAGRSL